MERLEPVLLVGLIPHGDTGAVLRVLSADVGLMAVFVHGARGRRLRPVMQIGNRLALDVAYRGPNQLPTATPHLLNANLAMLNGPGAMALVGHVSALVASLLPEAVAQPRLFAMADALLTAASAGAGPITLAATLARFELALLADLGHGLDLSCCAATGSRDDLAYVSPRSRQAVSRTAGAPWAGRLLPLPTFLRDGGEADAAAAADGLRLTGHFLDRDVLAGHRLHESLRAGRARAISLLLPTP